jgi:hypothetical protein
MDGSGVTENRWLIDALMPHAENGGPMWDAIELLKKSPMSELSGDLKQAVVYTLVNDGWNEAKVREKLGANIELTD